MLGAVYLCYEGAEKIWGSIRGHDADAPPVAEDELVSGAIRTDLVLSAEIMVIALNEVADQAFLPRLIILIVVALVLTVGVYGVVAVIVKMDDVGLRLKQTASRIGQYVGRGLVAAMPALLSALSTLGTLAMLWVGGHILLAGSDRLGWRPPYRGGPPRRPDRVGHSVKTFGAVLAWLVDTGASALAGFVVGAVAVALVALLSGSSRTLGLGQTGWHGEDVDGRYTRTGDVGSHNRSAEGKTMKDVAGYRETTGARTMRYSATLLVVMIACATAACSGSTRLPAASTSTATPSPVVTTLRAQPPLATDPAVLASDLSADEQALRDPSSSEAVLAAAAHRQQLAYRALGRHPEWDATVRAGISPSLVETYDRNVDARRQLTALSRGRYQGHPACVAHRRTPPADALLGYYHEAEAATGVGWNYLAAINLVETGFRPHRRSEHRRGGRSHAVPALDVRRLWRRRRRPLTPRRTMAAGRFLAANGFANDHDHAIFGYNHSGHYVGAVDDYTAVIASDPAAFAGYYRWDIYYNTTAGDVLLPVGYAESANPRRRLLGEPPPVIHSLQRVLNHQVSIGALIAVALWLAIPYLCIGFVWSSLHGEQVQQIQTRLEKLSPTGADLFGFRVSATALWPASMQIADACPASS